jgi:hypothetical protein
MRRVRSFLILLLSTRIPFPHEVEKATQLGLVLIFYKEDDSFRFRLNLRVAPRTFDALLALIQDDPVFYSTGITTQLPTPYQLAITLYRFGHYGSASSIEAVAQWAGCSSGAVVKSTRRVMLAFMPFHDRAIRWPTSPEKQKASDWVESVSCKAWGPGFAMVDGTLILLHCKPGHHGEQFYDRKSNYSLSLTVFLTCC